MSRALIRILADMVEAALDRRNSMRYDSDREDTHRIRPLSDMQEEVLPENDVAAILQRGVQGEGLPHSARSEEG